MRKPWRTIAGERLADSHVPELQVVIEGVFAPRRFLDLVRDFLVFEDDGSGRLVKKMAGYHQYHAVQVAVGETLRAAELARTGQVAEAAGRYEAGRKPGGKPGDRRVGVVWHTQGSGKSLTMAFYAGRIVREPAMENPTIVVLTDRNDLDDRNGDNQCRRTERRDHGLAVRQQRGGGGARIGDRCVRSNHRNLHDHDVGGFDQRERDDHRHLQRNERDDVDDGVAACAHCAEHQPADVQGRKHGDRDLDSLRSSAEWGNVDLGF